MNPDYKGACQIDPGKLYYETKEVFNYFREHELNIIMVDFNTKIEHSRFENMFGIWAFGMRNN